MRLTETLLELLIFTALKTRYDLKDLRPLFDRLFDTLESLRVSETLEPVLRVGFCFQESRHEDSSHHLVGSLSKCEFVPDLIEDLDSDHLAFTFPKKSVKNGLEHELQCLFEVVSVGAEHSEIIVGFRVCGVRLRERKQTKYSGEECVLLVETLGLKALV